MNFEPLKHLLSQYFSFSSSERNGIIVLCVMLFVVISINILIDYIEPSISYDFSDIENAIDEWKNESSEISGKGELFAFNPNTISEKLLDSLALPDNVKKNLIKYREKGGSLYNAKSFRKIYGMNDSIFDELESYIHIDQIKKNISGSDKIEKEIVEADYFNFNPNLVSKEQLIKLRFNDFQIQNVLKYRQNGGVFYSKTDILKIYGIDSLTYKNIEPWIDIGKPDSSFVNTEIVFAGLIDINVVDSSALLILYGIGPVFASRIINYRNLLGGFINKSQLLEVYNFDQKKLKHIENKIYVDTVNIKKLSLNFSGYSDFVRHPYLLSADVKKIINFRNKNGAFETYNDLVSKNIIDSVTFLRIKPYLEIN